MGVTQLTSSQCIPTPNVFSNRETHCAEHNGRVYDFLRYQAQPGIVVLVARWPLYLIGQRVEHENGCKEGDDFAGRYLSSADEVDREKEVANKIQETISGLIELGHKVVFVHAVPEPGCNVPGTLARYRLYSIQKNLQYSSEMHLQRKAMVSSRVVKQDDEDFIYFDPTDIYCDTNNQYCFVEDEIGLLHFDSNHPSLHASKLLAEGLVSAMHDQRWF